MLVYKVFFGFLLIFIFFHPKTQIHLLANSQTRLSLSSSSEKKSLESFFDYLGSLGRQESKPTLSFLESYMTDDCQIESNGSILSHGIAEFLLFLDKMQEKYADVSYSPFLESCYETGSQILFRFQVDCLQKDDLKKTLEALAIVTFREEKICKWIEIYRDETFVDLKNFYQASSPLFPICPPSSEGYLPVSETHTLFYATYGNPNRIPIIILHGGPGEGCSDLLTQFFDLDRYYVVMFDQRGSKRSAPFASMEENTPQHSVEDIETLRKHLKIDKWLIFGGSWGSTLAILYGQSYPDHCEGFILRGIFLGREPDYLHLLYGMGKMMPKAYEDFLAHIPNEEQADLLSSYYKRIMDPDPKIHLPAARSFIRFDAACVRFFPNNFSLQRALEDSEAVYCVAKHFFHYSRNKFFLAPDQLLSNMHKIKHIPAILIHGKYDLVTLPENAYLLHRKWDNSVLWMIPQGGHTSLELPIASALVLALNFFASK